MRIEECFELFHDAVTKYNSHYKNISFSIRESEQKDYLLCDVARVIGFKTHKSIQVIADTIVKHLPFEAEITANKDIKFNLWQEAKR